MFMHVTGEIITNRASLRAVFLSQSPSHARLAIMLFDVRYVDMITINTLVQLSSVLVVGLGIGHTWT